MSKVGKTWFARFAGIIDAVLGCLALLGGIILSPRILGQTARMPGFNIFVFVVIILHSAFICFWHTIHCWQCF